MHSALERTAGTSRSRRPGVLVLWIGLVLLCLSGFGVDFARAAAPLGLPADDCAVSAARLLSADAGPAIVLARSAGQADERDDRIGSAPADEAIDGLVEDTEPTEEIGETTAETDVCRFDTCRDARRLHRPDPICEWRRVRIGPTRAPPVIARTVG